MWWTWLASGGWLVLYMAVGLLVVAGVIAHVRWHPVRTWRYDRARAKHLVTEVVEEPAGQDFYGSMTLEGERPLRLPGQEAREAMLADLSPGALDEFYEWANYCTPHCPDDTCRAFGECAWRDDTPDGWGPRGPSESYAAWLTEGTDSGPGMGCSVLIPGPDLEDEDEQAAMDVRWLQGADQHHPRLASQRSAVPQMPQVDAGPDTARLAWLDQQLAAHADWARRVRGQVTEWGLEGAA